MYNHLLEHDLPPGPLLDTAEFYRTPTGRKVHSHHACVPNLEEVTLAWLDLAEDAGCKTCFRPPLDIDWHLSQAEPMARLAGMLHDWRTQGPQRYLSNLYVTLPGTLSSLSRLVFELEHRLRDMQDEFYDWANTHALPYAHVMLDELRAHPDTPTWAQPEWVRRSVAARALGVPSARVTHMYVTFPHLPTLEAEPGHLLDEKGKVTGVGIGRVTSAARLAIVYSWLDHANLDLARAAGEKAALEALSEHAVRTKSPTLVLGSAQRANAEAETRALVGALVHAIDADVDLDAAVRTVVAIPWHALHTGMPGAVFTLIHPRVLAVADTNPVHLLVAGVPAMFEALWQAFGINIPAVETPLGVLAPEEGAALVGTAGRLAGAVDEDHWPHLLDLARATALSA